MVTPLDFLDSIISQALVLKNANQNRIAGIQGDLRVIDEYMDRLIAELTDEGAL